ncbi:MAG: 16S rRNA (guanine(527)-N(7))-methyltransferase RsmG [Alphaproteobacteria bacterium]|nr:16S rRNA (guanine(527)-N(7))-methyltransferase RsmG [Alphaproteobacteria bacterium]
MTADEFAACEHVSRETIRRLDCFVSELIRWQARINLVSPKSLEDVWRRHIQDSAQLLPHTKPGSKILDLGSGAGFPGLILAIMGERLEVHLVESDQRKVAFMREAGRLTGANIHLHAVRIEKLTPFSVDFVTSRALSSLDHLLEFAYPFLDIGGQCLFLKGKSWQEELTSAEKKWMMRAESIPSRTDPEGAILKISEVRRGKTDRSEPAQPGKN